MNCTCKQCQVEQRWIGYCCGDPYWIGTVLAMNLCSSHYWVSGLDRRKVRTFVGTKASVFVPCQRSVWELKKGPGWQYSDA